MFKVESAVVQYVIREYNDNGELVGEGPAQPLQFFRASVPDIWAKGDELVAQASKTPDDASKSRKRGR